MNKHIVNALSNYGFSFEKNTGYGFINDYEVNVVNAMGAVGPVFLFSTYLSQAKKNEFIMKMNERKIKLVQSQAFDFGVSVMIGAMTAGGFEKKCAEVLPVILEILESIEAPKKDICPQSGEAIDELDSKTTTIPGSNLKIRLSNKAIETVNSSIEKSNEDFKNAPNNYLKGLFGIILGAIVGAAMTVGFALAGYVTALSSMVSVVLGTALYAKFGGKQNWVMVLMSLITTIVIIMGTLLIMYVVVCGQAAAENYLDINGFEALKFCIEASEEFSRLFFMDLALNAFFIILGEAFSISRLKKLVSRPKSL